MSLELLRLVKKEVELGNVNEKIHSIYPELSLFKYSQECVYSRKWNEVNKLCRGLVLNTETGDIIARGFSKFFNYEELEQMGESIPNEEYTIYEKLDGSLILAFMYKNKVIFATCGSFESDQVKFCEQLFKRNEFIERWNLMLEELAYCHFHEQNITFLFEIIYPDNKIVIDYGMKEDLILLSIIKNKNGKEFLDSDLEQFNFNRPKIYNKFNIDDILDLKKRPDFNNEEGFVVKFKNGYRVKIKYEEYFRLHKIISNVNEHYIWEALKDGKNLEEFLMNIPDETFEFIKNVSGHYISEYTSLEYYLHSTFAMIKSQIPADDAEYRKKFALQAVKHSNLSSALFSMLDGKKYEHILWKILEP